MSRSKWLLCIMCMSILPMISPAQEWVARYNCPANNTDEARALAVDNAGNVYVTGLSWGLGISLSDYATVKYNSSGVEQWVARYNGPRNESDEAVALAVDNSGNVYVTGFSEGWYTSYDYATVKYNSSGVEQWVARYNGSVDEWDQALAIAVDNSGNVYVTGESRSSTNTDYATVKYNSSGVMQWIACYNGPGNSWDGAYAISVDNEGNVYVTGRSRGLGTDCDYATVKYNSSGVEQWVARYNGPINGDDEATAMAIDNSGNIYVTGGSDGSPTWEDYATVKYNSSGVEQWVARYHCASVDRASALICDNSGNVYVTGESRGSASLDDYATVKYNSSGVEQWVSRYNGPNNSWDGAAAISVDNSGNVYVTGYSEGTVTSIDYATVKYDSSGVEQWLARYNGPGDGGDVASAIVVDDLGNIYVTGGSAGIGTGLDYATIKYVDAINPQPFSLISPQDSAILGTPRPTFIWQSSADIGSGLADYDVYIDNTEEHTVTDTFWTVDYDLSEDWHTWYIVANDSAGNQRQSNETWSLLIDATGPVIESTTVWEDTTYMGPYGITCKVWDELTGVDSVVLCYRRDEDPNWVAATMDMTGSPDWYIDSIPAVTNYDDTVRYYIEAVDIANPGNVATDPPDAPANCYMFVGNYVGVTEHENMPKTFSLRLTSNPIRGIVRFALTLPHDADVSLRIFDVAGRLVSTPISGKSAAGFYDVVWNCGISAGIYFYSLESPWERVMGKLVLVK